MKENSQAYLATEKIGVLMRKYSLPCIISLLVGALYNIVDQIFIANADYLGSYGNAANTVVFPLTVILTILYLCKPHILKLTKHDFGLKWNVIRRMLPLGICSFLSQISLVAAMAAINNMIRKYSSLDPIFGQAQYAQIPMAVVGIVMKFFQIFISIVVGMAAGGIPIVGYNMGAGIYQRVKKLFTCLLISEACVGAVALILVEGFPQALIGIFGAANESVYYTDFAIKSFRIYLCMIILACINKAAFIFLQAMGKAMDSTMLSMVREIVFGVGFALLLPILFGLDGVLYSMPVSDVLTAVISAVLIVKTYKQLSMPVAKA